MNKTVLTLVVLGVSCAQVHAQSDVVVYGSIDGGLRDTRNVDGAGHHRLTVGSNGTYYPNRLGLKGVEDLGGGLLARFNLETGFNTGTGALESTTGSFGSTTPSSFTGTGALFQRTATVGVGGHWGNIDIGRQYGVSFRTIGLYDPFSYKYSYIIPLTGIAAGNGVSQATGGTRFQNDAQYGGTFGPITVRAEWALGEVAGAFRTNSAQGIALSYSSGPLAVGAAYTRKKLASTAGLAAGGVAVAGPPALAGTAAATAASRTFDVAAYTFGAAYKWDAVRVTGGMNREGVDGALASTAVGGLPLTPSIGGADSRVRVGWFGAGVDMTPELSVIGAWYQSEYFTPTTTKVTTGKEDLFIVGVTYYLSKRTNLYGDLDIKKLAGNRIVGFGTAATQDRVTGVSVGITHLF
jgi:predicted porin